MKSIYLVLCCAVLMANSVVAQKAGPKRTAKKRSTSATIHPIANITAECFCEQLESKYDEQSEMAKKFLSNIEKTETSKLEKMLEDMVKVLSEAEQSQFQTDIDTLSKVVEQCQTNPCLEEKTKSLKEKDLENVPENKVITRQILAALKLKPSCRKTYLILQMMRLSK